MEKQAKIARNKQKEADAIKLAEEQNTIKTTQEAKENTPKEGDVNTVFHWKNHRERIFAGIYKEAKNHSQRIIDSMNLQTNDGREKRIMLQDVKQSTYNYYVDKFTQENAEIIKTIDENIETIIKVNQTPHQIEDEFVQTNKHIKKAKAHILDVKILKPATETRNRFEALANNEKEDTETDEIISETTTTQMLRAVDKIKGKTPANPQASTSAAKQYTPPPIITVGKQLPMTTEIIKGIKEHTTGFYVKHNNESSQEVCGSTKPKENIWNRRQEERRLEDRGRIQNPAYSHPHTAPNVSGAPGEGLGGLLQLKNAFNQ
ncbi:hypothetical protein JTB14_033251 [Gonioctena quinquepunctata]|nr:hypothetical protein JTB14_033251 [Gonioctena quinquepunctata]